MPLTISTADRIIEICNQEGVSIFLDGTEDHDSYKMGAYFTYEPIEKILTIFLLNLRDNTKQKLKPFFKARWLELGIIIIGEGEKTLESYIEYKQETTDREVLALFEPLIPHDDFTVLKRAFFLRSEKEMGHQIEQYKQEIWEEFRERGVYVSNLCNSGYFENELMVAAKSMPPEKFRKYYELMIGRELMGIFVHSKLKLPNLRDMFEERLINARRFKVPSIRVHGFGSWNVELIKRFFNSYKDDDDGMWNEIEIRTIESNSHPPSIIQEIILKPFES